MEKAKSRQTREKIRASYKEESDSDEYKDDISDGNDDEMGSEESESEWDAESSGSEYGKRKSKGKGKGKKVASPPKGRGRGRPSAKGRRGRAAAVSVRNGTRRSAAKKARAESESEEEAESSGSEYGKRPNKKPLIKKGRGRPKFTYGKKASPPTSTRGTRGRNAKRASYKEISEEEISEDEKPTKRLKKDQKDESDSGREDADNSKISSPESMEEDPPARSGKTRKDSEEEDESSDSQAPNKSEIEKLDHEKIKVNAAKKSSESEGETETHIKKKEEPLLKNKTDTDYSSMNFSLSKKTLDGQEWNFKISCWNVGGIKSWVKKNGLQYLKEENPDIMCLQEIKCSDKTKPSECKSINEYPFMYWAYSEQSGFHGVATLCKTEPVKITYGLPVLADDSDSDRKSKVNFNAEGRIITTEFDAFILVNAYVPNSGRGIKDEDHPKGYPPKIITGERQLFDKYFRSYIGDLCKREKRVIVTGDLNVAHQELDLANPKTNTTTAGFTKEEREDFKLLLEEAKLLDSFRCLYPDQKSYTFWSYMHNARQKNIGWRLDYFLVSEQMKGRIAESFMRSEVYGSDHCPIVLFFRV